VLARRRVAGSAMLLGITAATTTPLAAADPAPGSKCDQVALYGVHIGGMSCMYGIWTSDGAAAAPGTPCSPAADVRIATGSGKNTYWTTCRDGVWSPPYNPFTGS